MGKSGKRGVPNRRSNRKIGEQQRESRKKQVERDDNLDHLIFKRKPKPNRGGQRNGPPPGPRKKRPRSS